MSGGSAGRIQVPIVRNEEVRTLNTWNFDSITRPKIAPLPPSPPGLPHSNNDAKETQILLEGNIIVNEDQLRKIIQENVVCQTCIDKFHHEHRVRFHRFCDTYRRNAFTHLLESGKTTDEMLMKASDVLKKTTTTLWKDFLRLDVVKHNTYNAKCELTVNKSGLACTLEVHCTYRSQRCNGHSWHIAPMSDPQGRTNHLKTYDLNKQSIICAQQMGVGWVDMCRFFSLLGIRYIGQNSYENIEKHVGEVLLKIKDEALRDAMEEEKRLTQETYFTEEHGEQPGCAFGLYMG